MDSNLTFQPYGGKNSTSSDAMNIILMSLSCFLSLPYCYININLISLLLISLSEQHFSCSMFQRLQVTVQRDKPQLTFRKWKEILQIQNIFVCSCWEQSKTIDCGGCCSEHLQSIEILFVLGSGILKKRTQFF